MHLYKQPLFWCTQPIEGSRKGGPGDDHGEERNLKDGRKKETPKKDKQQSNRRIKGTTREERGCH